MKCKQENCTCEVPTYAEQQEERLSVAGNKDIDLNASDTAELGNADAIVQGDRGMEQFCSSHCTKMLSTGNACGCGHEECSQKEPMYTTRACADSSKALI